MGLREEAQARDARGNPAFEHIEQGDVEKIVLRPRRWEVCPAQLSSQEKQRGDCPMVSQVPGGTGQGGDRKDCTVQGRKVETAV